MPTENPRVNVTITPSMNAVVGRLAELQRVSKASVLRDLLETAEPGLRQALALMEAAQGAAKEVHQRLAADMDKAMLAADRYDREMADYFQNSLGDLVADAEAVRGRRPGRTGVARTAGAAASVRRKRKDPPSSNRGVKS